MLPGDKEKRIWKVIPIKNPWSIIFDWSVGKQLIFFSIFDLSLDQFFETDWSINKFFDLFQSLNQIFRFFKMIERRLKSIKKLSMIGITIWNFIQFQIDTVAIDYSRINTNCNSHEKNTKIFTKFHQNVSKTSAKKWLKNLKKFLKCCPTFQKFTKKLFWIYLNFVKLF